MSVRLPVPAESFTSTLQANWNVRCWSLQLPSNVEGYGPFTTPCGSHLNPTKSMIGPSSSRWSSNVNGQSGSDPCPSLWMSTTTGMVI